MDHARVFRNRALGSEQEVVKHLMATLFEAWEREILQSFGHPAARGLQCCENATTHLFAVARIDQKPEGPVDPRDREEVDRKSTRLNSSHANISYAVFCL